MATIFKAPVKDSKFVLAHVLEIDRYKELSGFAELDEETFSAILEGGGQFSEEVLHPINSIGDQQGCTYHAADNSVTTPEGFKEAYKALSKTGWATLSSDSQYGGQGLPYVLGSAVDEYLSAANMAFAMYPGLTSGAVSAISIVGSDEQKETYLPNMISGKWSGTMNLTEPQAGTDLGLIKTEANPADDGSWKITGTKIFISAGEHDLAENIIHLVLARTPGAPTGTRGISLFLVPKFLVNEDGSLGERNALSCGAIEKKMGIHGSATCVMNYDGATGYLLGEENKGLTAMFIMMNKARLGVGIQGLSQSEVAYQNAVQYVKERLQGRAPGSKGDKDRPADPLITQPDVRRILLNARAFNEGGRMLVLWGGLLSDLARLASTAEEREQAEDLLSLLTPIIKSALTDGGYQHATNMQQLYGGHGYIVENGVEQFVRDARITMIYEGANAVQALDLVGRKLPANNGRSLRAFLKLLGDGIAAAKQYDELASHVEAMQAARGELEQATMWLMQNGLADPRSGAAAASDYLDLFFYVAVGHLWLQAAGKVFQLLKAPDADKPFLEAKLVTARHYFERVLPMAFAHGRKLTAGAETLMAMPEDSF